MSGNGGEKTGGEGKRDRAIALGIARGDSYRVIAERVGRSRRTVERRAADPVVKNLVHQYRDRAIGSGLGLLCRGFRGAVKQLVQLSRYGGKDDAIRLGACRTLIESVLKVRSEVDIEERVRELELIAGETVQTRNELESRLGPPTVDSPETRIRHEQERDRQRRL